MNPDDTTLKWKKPATQQQILYNSIYMRYLKWKWKVVKFMETESRMVVAKGWG